MMDSFSELERAATAVAVEILREPQFEGRYDHLKRIFDHAVIETALRMTGGNQSQAARLLGMNRGTFRKKRKPDGLPRLANSHTCEPNSLHVSIDRD